MFFVYGVFRSFLFCLLDAKIPIGILVKIRKTGKTLNVNHQPVKLQEHALEIL